MGVTFAALILHVLTYALCYPGSYVRGQFTPFPLLIHRFDKIFQDDS